MKSTIFTFLFVAAFLFFSGCSEKNALVPNLDNGSLKSSVKPAATLNGEFEVTRDPNVTDPNLPAWDGTIDFVGFENTYGIRFYHLADNGAVAPQAYIFDERWEIYILPDGDVILSGKYSGVVSWANNKFRMNGEVQSAAEPFEGWIDRNVHIQGTFNVTLTDPEDPAISVVKDLGTFRIN